MDHRDKFIESTREPIRLADYVFQKGFIGTELKDTILSRSYKQKQTREIFDQLNTEAAYELVYDWLKENETALIKELGKPLHCSPRLLINMHKVFTNMHFINLSNINFTQFVTVLYLYPTENRDSEAAAPQSKLFLLFLCSESAF